MNMSGIEELAKSPDANLCEETLDESTYSTPALQKNCSATHPQEEDC